MHMKGGNKKGISNTTKGKRNKSIVWSSCTNCDLTYAKFSHPLTCARIVFLSTQARMFMILHV